jgi:hypothetical protein
MTRGEEDEVVTVPRMADALLGDRDQVDVVLDFQRYCDRRGELPRVVRDSGPCKSSKSSAARSFIARSRRGVPGVLAMATSRARTATGASYPPSRITLLRSTSRSIASGVTPWQVEVDHELVTGPVRIHRDMGTGSGA